MGAVLAGLDWASRIHAVCVIDERGAACRQFEVAHDAEGLRDLVLRLREAGVRRIAVERPSGLLVVLRTDGHRFKPLAAQSDEVRALRALVRGRDDLVATRVQLANQLRSVLQSYGAGAAEVFADVDSPIALAFIQRYCTHGGLQKMLKAAGG